MFKGNLIAQVISVIGALFVAKLYGSEAYGVYAVFLSVSGVLTIINTLQLEYAVVLSNNKEEAKSIMNLILIMPFLISVLISVLFFVFHYFFFDKIDPYILLFAILASVFLSQNKGLEAFLTLQKKFNNLSKIRVVTSFLTIFFQLTFFYFFKIKGLIIGSFLSAFIITLFYLKLNYKSIGFFNFSNFKNSIKKYNNLIKYALPSNFINALANYIMPVLVLVYFGSSESGVYAFGMKVLALPLFFISSTIYQVYFEKASKLYVFSKDKLYSFTRKIVVNNFLIIIIFLLFINTLGVKLLTLFFNENWENLSLTILILSFYILAKSTFNPISTIVEITNKNKVDLIFNCYLLLVNIISIFIGVLYNNLIYLILFFSFFSGIGYLFIFKYFMDLLKQYRRKVL